MATALNRRGNPEGTRQSPGPPRGPRAIIFHCSLFGDCFPRRSRVLQQEEEKTMALPGPQATSAGPPGLEPTMNSQTRDGGVTRTSSTAGLDECCRTVSTHLNSAYVVVCPHALATPVLTCGTSAQRSGGTWLAVSICSISDHHKHRSAFFLYEMLFRTFAHFSLVLSSCSFKEPLVCQGSRPLASHIN